MVRAANCPCAIPFILYKGFDELLKFYVIKINTIFLLWITIS